MRQLRVNEIIVAVRQQRGGVLPLRALLECRLNGVQVTDLARFFERVHGQVPIESLKASWLIYGNGFRQGWSRSFVKRTFDIVVASTLLLVHAAGHAYSRRSADRARERRPGHLPAGARRAPRADVLRCSSSAACARTPRRTARRSGRRSNDPRVTRSDASCAAARIDELPQLINVLRGEMSFVGPRPERPVFVAMLTEQIPFYAVRHSVKPGITGWAQVRYSYGADVEQSVKKLEYDLYYVKNHSLFLDLLILLETVRVVLLGEGAR